jgi:hypothetical protein
MGFERDDERHPDDRAVDDARDLLRSQVGFDRSVHVPAHANRPAPFFGRLATALWVSFIGSLFLERPVFSSRSPGKGEARSPGSPRGSAGTPLTARQRSLPKCRSPLTIRSSTSCGR